MHHVTPENSLSTDQELAELRLPAPEEVMVTSRKVACDGDDLAGLGHPRVWLAIAAETGFVDCPYCDKRFVIDPEHAHGGH